jgi:hypothetical protein
VTVETDRVNRALQWTQAWMWPPSAMRPAGRQGDSRSMISTFRTALVSKWHVFGDDRLRRRL